jgi:3',5'-cyclic AMP phosphodiesterase CpdA
MFLLDGYVPYAIAPGNHDYGPKGGTADRTTFFNDYFPVARYLAWPTFGGVKDVGRLDNSYHLFSAGGVDWLVLALEFGPRNGSVAWASQIASNYPARKIILITHAYLYYDNTRYDWATKGSAQIWNPHAYGTASDPDGTNDGEELWQKLVKQHPNFVLVVNGHVLADGLGQLSSTGDHGNVVHQMLVNYQVLSLGGEAFLRLLEFLPDGKTVQVKSLSPLYGTYKTDPENQFRLTLQPPLR